MVTQEILIIVNFIEILVMMLLTITLNLIFLMMVLECILELNITELLGSVKKKIFTAFNGQKTLVKNRLVIF